MVVNNLYKLKRGNQTQAVGLIVKGATASLQILGSQTLPLALADLEDCTDGITLDKGTWSFLMLPEYVYFTGTADRIDLLGMGYEDLNKTLV